MLPASQRRNHVDVVVAFERSRDGLGLGSLADDLKPVTEPLHGRAGDEDRAFEGVLNGLFANSPRDRSEQLFTLHRAGAGIHQEE